MCSSTLCHQTAVHMPTVSSQQVYIMLLTTRKITHLACDGLMLGQRCGRWVSVHMSQGQCAVFVEKAGYRYILGRRGTLQTQVVEPMLAEFWARLEDDEPTLSQHWFNVSCFWGRFWERRIELLKRGVL